MKILYPRRPRTYYAIPRMRSSNADSAAFAPSPLSLIHILLLAAVLYVAAEYVSIDNIYLRMAYRTVSVSYTHLDVYKRQKIYYPDSRYYKNNIDSIVNTYNVSYNDKEDMEQYLIHSVE